MIVTCFYLQVQIYAGSTVWLPAALFLLAQVIPIGITSAKSAADSQRIKRCTKMLMLNWIKKKRTSLSSDILFMFNPAQQKNKTKKTPKTQWNKKSHQHPSAAGSCSLFSTVNGLTNRLLTVIIGEQVQTSTEWTLKKYSYHRKSLCNKYPPMRRKHTQQCVEINEDDFFKTFLKVWWW